MKREGAGCHSEPPDVKSTLAFSYWFEVHFQGSKDSAYWKIIEQEDNTTL